MSSVPPFWVWGSYDLQSNKANWMISLRPVLTEKGGRKVSHIFRLDGWLRGKGVLTSVTCLEEEGFWILWPASGEVKTQRHEDWRKSVRNFCFLGCFWGLHLGVLFAETQQLKITSPRKKSRYPLCHIHTHPHCLALFSAEYVCLVMSSYVKSSYVY